MEARKRAFGPIHLLWLFAAGIAQAVPFNITLNITGGLTLSQQAIFATAEQTWESLIPNYAASVTYLGGLTINASGAPIDGVGGILGSAGPNSAINNGGFVLATTGTMVFDTADLANMEANGTLLSVILHEMAHVMGFGTLWTFNGVYTNDTGQYTGALALSTYRNEFNQPGATSVPVELGGGAGTANGHWDEVNGGGGPTGFVSNYSGLDMQFELMTGWLNPGSFISLTTLASFEDIGYDAADIPEPATMALAGAALISMALWRKRRG
jgi:hypothetical protein